MRVPGGFWKISPSLSHSPTEARRIVAAIKIRPRNGDDAPHPAASPNNFPSGKKFRPSSIRRPARTTFRAGKSFGRAPSGGQPEQLSEREKVSAELHQAARPNNFPSGKKLPGSSIRRPGRTTFRAGKSLRQRAKMARSSILAPRISGCPPETRINTGLRGRFPKQSRSCIMAL